MKSHDLGLEKLIETSVGKFIHDGSLELKKSKITELPNDLIVLDNLYLRNVPKLQNIPGSLKANYIKIN